MATAIACSGLGWVRRGNEAWAQGAAEALSAAGEDVVLFGHGALRTPCRYRRVATLRRDHFLWRAWLNWGRRYTYEQSLFASRLLPVLHRMGCEIVHTGDPQVAWYLRKHGGADGPAVVYKDGLFLGPTWNRLFDWVQVLAPSYQVLGRAEGVDTIGWRVIPHFVDPGRFAPTSNGRPLRDPLPRSESSASLRVLSVGALALQSNKRLEWVAQEVAQVPEAELRVVGQAAPRDQEDFERRIRPLLGLRLNVLTNVSPETMPAIYAASDVFVHAAVREPFGIVFLEAMASGLPVVGHTFEVTRWIIGEGGKVVDMEEPGALAAMLRELKESKELRRGLGEAGRRRVESCFSPRVVVPRYRELYAEIRAARGDRRLAHP